MLTFVKFMWKIPTQVLIILLLFSVFEMFFNYKKENK